MPGTWETSPAPSDSVAREAFDPQRPLSSNAIPRGSGRSWPNLAAKPTLQTALCGFTVGQEWTLEFPASGGDLLQTAALLKRGWTSTPFVRVRVLNRGELARTA